MRKDVLAYPPPARRRRRAHIAWRVVSKPKLNLPLPWFLEREYRQHRSIDPEGLPPTFAAWRQMASDRATQLARLTDGRIVKVVIHPGELEAWARQTGRAVDDAARSAFAKTLWLAVVRHEITR